MKEARIMAGVLGTAPNRNSEYNWVRVSEAKYGVGLVVDSGACLTVAEARYLADRINEIATRTEKRLADSVADEIVSAE